MLTNDIKAPISLLILSFFLLFSCFGGKKDIFADIELPATSELTGDFLYGVITSSFLRVHEDFSLTSEVSAVLRKGNILKIITKSPEKDIVEEEEDYWYLIDFYGIEGWVFGSYLDIYHSIEKAEEASAGE